MAGYAMFQPEEPAKEILLLTAKYGHVATSFTPTNDGQQADHEHVMEIMAGGIADTGILNPLKKIDTCLHCTAPNICIF